MLCSQKGRQHRLDTPDSTIQPPCSEVSIHSFLKNYDRKRKEVKGDGNCLFRALSDQIFGSEEHHLFVRTLLVRFENFNSRLFAKHIHSAESNIEAHIHKMATPSKWGTDLEIIAAATYFQKPIFYVTNASNTFHWEVIHPLKSSSALHYPEVVDCPGTPETFTHLELEYISNAHYNSIVSTATGKCALNHPVISQNHVFIETVI